MITEPYTRVVLIFFEVGKNRKDGEEGGEDVLKIRLPYITLGYSVLCFALQQARPCIQVYNNVCMGHIQRTDRYDAALLNRHGERTVSFKKGRGAQKWRNIFFAKEKQRNKSPLAITTLCIISERVAACFERGSAPSWTRL